ncbi:glycoside hydrolase family 43 protein [Paenibacillus puerhi]|uniref:glycoside hydrolase family 43 protein n=1 Tax=Paenibacillus puerhi TaxID=2692622 RepID=UPI0013597931|nr:glycoside hydrolase family 43 protein [Paenibacillus puerhi]
MSTNHSSVQRYDAYLFCYFTVEDQGGEQVYFSLSKDGLHWKDLNGGQPVLISNIGEGGVRDPFILRSPLDQKFYIIATDLRINAGKGWDVAKNNGSRSIIIWESEDLIHWSTERSVEVDLPGAGCVWAPESIYDESTSEHLIFWASMVEKDGNPPKQIIYSFRTKDFRSFSKPEVYIERDNHIIDTTIIKADEVYYRFSKDEATKCITLETGSSLSSSSFTYLHAPVLVKIQGVEGPAIFKFNDRDEWCLLVDQYRAQKGYFPLVSKDLSTGDFHILSENEYDMGHSLKRHGSVLNITRVEYETLLNTWEK